ncbi:MAG: lipoyl(octanoyl) transferase LipB, partial [Muribaculaceae bacterium]|nr:lipoyl(octanoyl) transferase LipB [Muribaculaceae bacterium]
MNIEIIDKGIVDYSEMLALQRELFSEMVGRKKIGLPIDHEYIFLLEHNPVITLGKHAKSANVLLAEEELRKRGIEIYRIERGGDVTYHGPGQLIAYPLLDLEAHKMGIKNYVDMLEEAVILTLTEYGLQGERVEGASGVWLDAGTEGERKICALGVKCSRYITMHGLALNVNTDMDAFRMINPCGFIDKSVTSIAIELNKEVDINEVKHILGKELKYL